MKIPALAALAAVTAVTAAAAAPRGSTLFISPCGEPFVAAAGEPYPVAVWFKKTDTDGDGKISRAEMRADADAFFNVLDRNKDGVIDPTEVNIYEHYMVPEILSVGQLDLPRPPKDRPLKDQPGFSLAQEGPEPIVPGGDQPSELTPRERLNTQQGAVQFSFFQEPEPVRAADRNFDYMVDRAEFAAHADRHFKALDANGDGFITWQELPITPSERASGVRKR